MGRKPGWNPKISSDFLVWGDWLITLPWFSIFIIKTIVLPLLQVCFRGQKFGKYGCFVFSNGWNIGGMLNTMLASLWASLQPDHFISHVLKSLVSTTAEGHHVQWIASFSPPIFHLCSLFLLCSWKQHSFSLGIRAFPTLTAASPSSPLPCEDPRQRPRTWT